MQRGIIVVPRGQCLATARDTVKKKEKGKICRYSRRVYLSRRDLILAHWTASIIDNAHLRYHGDVYSSRRRVASRRALSFINDSFTIKINIPLNCTNGTPFVEAEGGKKFSHLL